VLLALPNKFGGAVVDHPSCQQSFLKRPRAAVEGDGSKVVIFAGLPYVMIHALFDANFEYLARAIKIEAGCRWPGGEDTGRWRGGMGSRYDQVGIPIDRIHAVGFELPVKAVLLDYADGVNLDQRSGSIHQL
jgi:hypothetical protein